MTLSFFDLEKFVNKAVKVQGHFVGWQTTKCKFLAQILDKPLTRSDWAIENDNFCVFVTGGTPEGLSLFNPTTAGRLVEVEADVLKTTDGKIYLKYRSGRVLK